MSQFTHTQQAAALLIFDKATTPSEFMQKFNKTYDTKHDIWDTVSLLHEFEVAGIAKRQNSHGSEWNEEDEVDKVGESGETVFVPIANRFSLYEVVCLKHAIAIEDSHRKAYWAQHS